MVLIHVSAEARPEVIATFEQTIESVCEGALALEGCTRYDWYRVPGNAARYVVFGEFASREAFQHYRKSSVVHRIVTEILPLLVTPPPFRHYEATVFESS